MVTDDCPVCDGLGFVPFRWNPMSDEVQDCEYCKGTGENPKPRKPKTDITTIG